MDTQHIQSRIPIQQTPPETVRTDDAARSFVAAFKQAIEVAQVPKNQKKEGEKDQKKRGRNFTKDDYSSAKIYFERLFKGARGFGGATFSMSAGFSFGDPSLEAALKVTRAKYSERGYRPEIHQEAVSFARDACPSCLTFIRYVRGKIGIETVVIRIPFNS